MKILVLILFAFMEGLVYAQDLRNTSIIFPEEHIAYRGYHNHLVLDGLEFDSTVYIVRGIDTLPGLWDEKFVYTPKTKSETDTLHIFSGGKYINSIAYKIERLYKPRIVLGNVRDTVVRKEELLCNPGLYCTYEPQLLKCDIRVIEFDGSIIKRSGREVPLYEKPLFKRLKWSEEKSFRYYAKQYPEYVSMSQFSAKQMKQIRKMKPGETIWFKTATVISPDSRANRIDLDLKFQVTI